MSIQMKIVLVSDGMHDIITNYRLGNLDIVNKSGLSLADAQHFLQIIDPKLEGILITDEAFNQQPEQDRKDLLALLEWLRSNHGSQIQVIYVTKDISKEAELADLIHTYRNFKMNTYDYVRIPALLFKQTIEQMKENGSVNQKKEKEKNTKSSGETKGSFLDRFKPKPKLQPELTATDSLSKELEKISRGISRVVAVTGHRGSGLTSTVINVATEASKRGLSVMIVDMDIDYRSTNMYLNSFHERTKRDEAMNASLIRTLARPQDYMTTAFYLKENMWITALGYEFADRKLVDQFYNSGKLVGLISMLRNKFNLVVLDMPFDLLKAFKETLIHVDVFGLCVPNNLYSVLSSMRNMEAVLDDESISYLNAKSRVIVTKYNDRSRFQNDIFTPERVSKVMSSGLLNSLSYEMKVAGYVPYSHDFDSQIETDLPLVHTSTEYERAYGNILLRLMEGAG